MRDVAVVGGKNASSGELIRSLAASGIRVPQGFAISAEAYREIITSNKLDEPITRTLAAYRNSEIRLSAAGAAIRELIARAALPAELVAGIGSAYRALAGSIGQDDPAVAV